MYYINAYILYSDTNTHATINFCIRKMTLGINTHNLWSNSNIKDVLAPYAEGFASEKIDNKKYYTVHRNTSLSWFV